MDASNPQIPVMKQPASLMEVGPNGNDLASHAAARHPVDDLQRAPVGQHSIQYVRSVYGSGLAMRLATEQKIAMEQERSGGSSLFREICTGRDVQLEFADFLSLPEYRPDVQKINHHKIMESQLGM